MKPRRPIRKVSVRQSKRLAEYARVKRQWWKRVALLSCPVMVYVFGIVAKVSRSPHHLRGRIGSLLTNTRYWLAVSERGHEWIHRNPAQARQHGWLCQRGDWGRQA